MKLDFFVVRRVIERYFPSETGSREFGIGVCYITGRHDLCVTLLEVSGVSIESQVDIEDLTYWL